MQLLPSESDTPSDRRAGYSPPPRDLRRPPLRTAARTAAPNSGRPAPRPRSGGLRRSPLLSCALCHGWPSHPSPVPFRTPLLSPPVSPQGTRRPRPPPPGPPRRPAPIPVPFPFVAFGKRQAADPVALAFPGCRMKGTTVSCATKSFRFRTAWLFDHRASVSPQGSVTRFLAESKNPQQYCRVAIAASAP